jgi:hypothetical protein
MNDQVDYWHKTLSFTKVGMKPGYYTIGSETVPASDLGRYGVNGPFYPVIYGLIGDVVGWQSWTSIPINFALLGSSLVAFAAVARLRVWQAALSSLAVVCIWAVPFYAITAMQEALNQAIAIALAGVFVRALSQRAGTSRRERVLSIVFVVVATVLRFSWGLLLIPLLVLYANKLTKLRAVAILFIGVVPMLASMLLVSRLQAPGANSILDRMRAVGSSPWAGVSKLAEVTSGNAAAFFRASYTLVDGGPQNWQILGVIAVAAAVVVPLRWFRARQAVRFASGGMDAPEAWFHLVNLGTIVVASWVLYLPGPGYWRIFGSALVVSVLVMIARRRVVPVALFVATCLLMFPAFDALFRLMQTPNFEVPRPMWDANRTLLAQSLKYQTNAPTPWCNTVLIPVELLDWRATLLPAGMGIDTYFPPHFPIMPKAQWVMLPVGWSIAPPGNMPLLSVSGAGKLYRNQYSACHNGH